MEITAEAIRRMKESMRGITDHRRQWGNLLHGLTGVLVVALTTIVAGWGEFAMTEEFGNAKQDFFKQFLEPLHGIPDDRTIGRLFARLQAGELPERLR
jgi:hypothetical protein